MAKVTHTPLCLFLFLFLFTHLPIASKYRPGMAWTARGGWHRSGFQVVSRRPRGIYYAKVDGADDREDGFEVGNAQTIRDSDWTSPSMPRDTRDGHGVLPLSRHLHSPTPRGAILPLNAQTL